MAVSYSLFANAGYQFFDNNGQMLSGGKLYTYLAGTNTNLTTYNSSSGTVANSNPIILDSSGRLTSEIWVTNGVSSKYVLKTSTDVLIATWDNIPSLSTALNGSGTANGVAYFNSINQFTSGANLTFDGSNLVASGSVTAGGSVAVGTNITVGGTATVTGTIASTGGITSATPAVTQAANDSSTKIATTEFVKKYSPTEKIQTIGASVGSNQLTVTLEPTFLDFRATPVTSAAVTSIGISSQLSLIVPVGTTMGMTSGVSARLVVLVVLNGSTPQLALANANGGNILDETNVINTLTTAALAQTIFSSSVLTNVPYRIVGFIDITCPTAGVWTADPTEIQGAGGQAMKSVAYTGTGVNVEYITSSTTWNVPVGVTKAFVWVFGAAGGGYYNSAWPPAASGGQGGYASAYVTGLSGSVVVTVGVGGLGASNGTGTTPTAGGASSFGSYVTANGGTAANPANTPPTQGTVGTSTLGLTATRTRMFCGLEATTDKASETWLSSGRGNTDWKITYTESPGTPYAYSTSITTSNGIGGAVIIQY